MASHVSDAERVWIAPRSDTDQPRPGSFLPLIGMAAGCWGLILWVVTSIF
jgi:hypothetical protein